MNGVILGIVLNIATGVLGNIAQSALDRVLREDEKKRFKKIVRDVLENYEVKINENIARELFESLILGERDRVMEIVEKNGLNGDFVNEIEKRMLLDEKLRGLIAEIRWTRLLEEIRDALVGERVEELLEDYKAFLVERFRYLDLKGFSPRIPKKRIVRIPLDDLFVPLKLEDEEKREEVDFLDVLNFDRCVVLGDPGSGKTTLLRMLAYLNRDLALIPIYVRISEYSEKRIGLFKYLKSQRFGKLYEWALKSGRALVLLDGLDEVIDTAVRMKVAEDVKDLISAFPSNRFVITSRSVGYEIVRLPFKHFIVKPFGEKQIEAFAKKWYRAIAEVAEESLSLAEENAKRLIDAIFENESVKRLSTNPLLLTIIALIHHRGLRLPNRRVELYQVCVETLLEHWVLQRLGSEDKLKDKNDIIEILSPIAFHIHSTSPSGLIGEDEFFDMIVKLVVERLGYNERDARREAKEFKKYIEEECGLFLEKGKEEFKSLYGFLHLTFQEYLASLELIRMWKEGNLKLEDYIFDPRWIEVVRLAVAELNTHGNYGRIEASRFVEDILNVEDEFEEAKRPLILAGYILSDDVRLKPGLEREIIDGLFDAYLSVPHWGEDKLYSEFRGTLEDVFKALLNSEKGEIVKGKIKDLALKNPKAVFLLYLLGSDALDVMIEISKYDDVEFLRPLAWVLFTLEGHDSVVKLSEVIDNLILKDDFVILFYILISHHLELMKDPKEVDVILKSENFKKIVILLSDPPLFLPLNELARVAMGLSNHQWPPLFTLLDKLARDENPKIREVAKKVLESLTLGEETVITHVEPFFHPAIEIFGSIKFALVTTKDFEVEFVELSNDPIEFMERVKTLNIPRYLKLSLIEECVDRKKLSEIVDRYENEIDILVAIVKPLGDDLFSEWIKYRKLHLNQQNPTIKLLLAYINKEKPSKDVIKACIERFRKERNKNNRNALFYLLFHFLNPFKV